MCFVEQRISRTTGEQHFNAGDAHRILRLAQASGEGLQWKKNLGSARYESLTACIWLTSSAEDACNGH